MKKITLTLLVLICFLSAFTQHPVGNDSLLLQTLGSSKTLVKSKGTVGSDSGLVNSVYPDTTSANFGKIRNYPGAMIRTGDSLWMRNYNATEWLLFNIDFTLTTPTWEDVLNVSGGSDLLTDHTINLAEHYLIFNGSDGGGNTTSLGLQAGTVSMSGYGSSGDGSQFNFNETQAEFLIVRSGNSYTQELPQGTGVLALSVNGNLADATGNIVITALAPVLTNSHIFVGDALNVATDVPMSGDVSIDNTGNTAVDWTQGYATYDPRYLVTTTDNSITWSVLDILNTPPGSPADGDIYLVGTSPTGAFTAHANEITTWDATGVAWTFDAATTGDLLNNVDENSSADVGIYQFNGSTWTLVSNINTSAWLIGGNSGFTNPKLGTIDNKGLRFIAHNKQWLTVASNKTITWNDFTGGGTGFLKVSAAGVMSRDNSTYLTTNQAITVTATGDATGVSSSSATAPSLPLTLATVNSNVGTFGDATHTVQITANGKGLITAISNAAITGFASSTLTSAHIFVGNVSNVATDVAMSGDIAITNAGVTAIGTNKVTNAMIRQSSGLSVIGRSTNTTGNVADITGTDGQVLRVSGTSLEFGAAVVAGGGTGNTTFTAYSVITAGTTAAGAFQNVSGVGSSGQVLTSNGAGTLPTWQTVSSGAVSSVSNSDGTLTISPTTGAVIASIALGHANTWTAKQTIQLTTQQLALGYDASNHFDITVGATGTTTVTLTGTSPILNINNNTTVTGQTALSNGTSQNLLIGSTATTGFQYRTTNGGSNTNASFLADLASAKTTAGNISVAMDGSATNGALMFLQGNGTRAIRGAYITPSGLTSTAGSEVMGLDFGTQTGGTTATVKMTLTGAGSLGIGTISPNALLNVEKDNISATVTNGLIIENTQAAISGTQQYSPALSLIGRGWTTASGGSSVASEFRIYTSETQASPQGITLNFSSYSAGSARVNPAMTIVDDGITNVKVNAPNFTATVNMVTPTINGSTDLNVTGTMKLFTATRDVVISPVTLTDNGYRLAIIGSESVTGGLSVSAATTPSTTSVTISHTGVTGSTSYTYKYIGVTADGYYSDVSAAITTSDGNATLDGTHTNNIGLGNRNWTEGYTSLRIYRTASSGTPSSTGLIGTAAITGGSMSTFIDNGLVGDGTVPQIYNSTGIISANKLKITTGGGNANIGTATLSGGTVTVSTTAVTASSIIFLTDATTGALTNVGSPTVGTITAGTSFVINSTNPLDASSVNWIIIN